MVVVDEAYARVRPAPARRGAELLPARTRGLVVTRTMSKAFALAGGRLGYLAADPAVGRRAAAGAAAVPPLGAHPGGRPGRARARRGAAGHASTHLRAERDAIVGWLRALGLEVADSDANFVLFGTVRGPARDLAGSAGPRRAGPRDRPGRLAAGHRRHAGGDGGVPGRARARCCGEVQRTMSRTARVERETAETKVIVELDLDGSGRAEVSTGVRFFDHMLATLAQARRCST